MTGQGRRHAVVVGGSIAGLLAARVLSDHFERVTIVERDRLPQEGDYRKGVPQAHHLHTLLVRGQQIMEELFPGFTQDLKDAGAPTAVWGKDNLFCTTGGWTQTFDSGIVSNVCARAEMEWLLRRRVSAIPNITFLCEQDVQGLLTDASRQTTTGLKLESRVDRSVQELLADLVVDASGRGSKAPEWLKEQGYDAPAETLIDAHCGYATRWYERPTQLSKKGLGIQARPAEGLYRGGAWLEVECEQLVVTLLGANGDYPPTEEAAFLEYARSLASPAIYERIKDAKPISPIYGYRNLANRMRHYERLARRPENFIVTGDAACALNPIYGQGMSTAALEALMLGDLLKQYQTRSLMGFAARFQNQLFKLVQGPWQVSTAEDLRYPDVTGAKPGLFSRFSNRYFDWMSLAMPHDNQVTKAFFESMNLLRTPTSLMTPILFLRILRHSVFGRKSTINEQRSTGEWKAAPLN